MPIAIKDPGGLNDTHKGFYTHDTGAIKTAGQIAYEIDCALRPAYHDGTQRKAWAALGEVEQWSWERGW